MQNTLKIRKEIRLKYLSYILESISGGKNFLKLPENQTLKKTLALSSRGFQIKGETKDKLTQLIPEIVESDGTRKIIRLLEALHSISESAEYEFLTSANF